MRGEGKAAQAYHRIERMIVFQQVAPGALISEATLMEQTGLGRTPVREALQQLARNRMVEIYPNKGVLIPPTSVESQLRMLELRRVLEALAVGLACHRATNQDHLLMTAVVASLTEGTFTLEEYAETVRQTHDLIATAAHNDYLTDAMAPLQGLSRRFWISHVIDEQAEIRTGAALHTAILRAILAGDHAQAESASHNLNDYLVDFAHATLTRP